MKHCQVSSGSHVYCISWVQKFSPRLFFSFVPPFTPVDFAPPGPQTARPRLSRAVSDTWWIAGACTFFILIGLLFIPYPGIQNDEALFAGPLYGPIAREFRVRVFHHDLSLMLMTYLGSLKTWIYAGIFRLWQPNIWSLRLPMLLAGTITIWLFGRLLLRSCGKTAAVFGCALLVCDCSYLLTTVFDWGPVALQHLLLVAGALLVLLSVQDHSRLKLASGFFLFGLGMWDKALFAWALGGLVIATAAVFPRELRRNLTTRNLALAVVAFSIGALPLIIYNVRNPLKTFRGNARFSTEQFAGKANLVRLTLNGSALFGYLVNEDWEADGKQPHSMLERASVAVRSRLGEHRTGLLFWAFAAAVLAVPFWWRSARRPVLFGIVFLAVAWLQMAFTKDAGGGVHHVILLWPFPHFVIAVVLAAIAKQFRAGPALAAAAAIVICGSGLLVTNQYLAQFIRNGASVTWTDAAGPLSDELSAMKPNHVFVMEWGMFDVLRMLNRGSLTLWNGADVIDPANGGKPLRQALSLENAVFLTRAADREITPGTRDRLRTMASESGYRQHMLRTIKDSNGRPIFEISTFQPGP
jgi:4-amino-4-deoxy-L-arabinose transferase-like glycosyltransferase